MLNAKDINRLTNEIAVVDILYPCFSHGFGKHVLVRLAEERLGSVVAEGDALELVLNLEEADDTAAMGYVGVCEEPQSELGPIHVLEQLSQLWAGFYDALEGQSVLKSGAARHITLV